MKTSALQETIKNFKTIGYSNAGKKIVKFAKRFENDGDRELNLSEQYALAMLLFEKNEEGLIQLLQHQIWDDPFRTRSDAYCNSMFQAMQLLKINGMLKPLYMDAISGRENCLEMARKLVELDQAIELDKPSVEFLKKYEYGFDNASKLLLRLNASKILFPEVLEYILTLKVGHEWMMSSWLPAFEKFSEEGILFLEGKLNKKILDLYAKTQANMSVSEFLLNLNKPVEKPIEKVVVKPVEKNNEKVVVAEKPAAVQLSKPTEKPVEKKLEKPAEETVIKPVEKPVVTLVEIPKPTMPEKAAETVKVVETPVKLVKEPEAAKPRFISKRAQVISFFAPQAVKEDDKAQTTKEVIETPKPAGGIAP